MNEKEKAISLVERFHNEIAIIQDRFTLATAKQCAIIHCNESIKIVNRLKKYVLGIGACDSEITELETIITEIEQL